MFKLLEDLTGGLENLARLNAARPARQTVYTNQTIFSNRVLLDLCQTYADGVEVGTWLAAVDERHAGHFGPGGLIEEIRRHVLRRTDLTVPEVGEDFVLAAQTEDKRPTIRQPALRAPSHAASSSSSSGSSESRRPPPTPAPRRTQKVKLIAKEPPRNDSNQQPRTSDDVVAPTPRRSSRIARKQRQLGGG